MRPCYCDDDVKECLDGTDDWRDCGHTYHRHHWETCPDGGRHLTDKVHASLAITRFLRWAGMVEKVTCQ
jgi:hypothetical protein